MVNVRIVLVVRSLLLTILAWLIDCRRLRVTSGQETGSRSGAGRAWSGSRIFLSIAGTLPQHPIFIRLSDPQPCGGLRRPEAFRLETHDLVSFHRAVGRRPRSGCAGD